MFIYFLKTRTVIGRNIALNFLLANHSNCYWQKWITWFILSNHSCYFFSILAILFLLLAEIYHVIYFIQSQLLLAGGNKHRTPSLYTWIWVHLSPRNKIVFIMLRLKSIGKWYIVHTIIFRRCFDDDNFLSNTSEMLSIFWKYK